MLKYVNLTTPLSFQDEPVQPKYDVNAPDLYIPTMAYATYVLLVGYILGLRNAFRCVQLRSHETAAGAEIERVPRVPGTRKFLDLT